MKRSVLLLAAAALSAAAWSQTTTPPAASQTPPASPTSIKPRGPDAVATEDPTRVVATIDGRKITAKEANEMLKPFPPEQRKQYESNLPKMIEQIYTREQLAESARKLNLEQQSPWKERMVLAQQEVLAQAYVAHVTDAAEKATANDAQKYYDANPAEFDMVKLSGIFVAFNPPGTPAAGTLPSARTEEQAREKATDLEKKIQAGGDFTALARSESDNQASAAKGGDLGSYPINDPEVKIPPDIKTAIQKLKPGQVSEPIRIQNNSLLIIKLESAEKLSFEKARPAIAKKLQQAALKQELDKYKIQVQDQDFFDTSASGAKIPSLQRPGTPVAPPAKP